MARADQNTDAARAHYNKGVAAYALEHYAEAATEYEAAFSLKTDSALLYNAAQAHRLAGNLERAQHLYQNYLRMFGGKSGPFRDKVEKQLAGVEAAIEAQKTSGAVAGTSKPPTTPPPAQDTPPTPPPDVTPPNATATLTEAPVETRKPVYKKAWFWGTVVGTVVVVGAALGVGLGIGLSSTKSPNPSFGNVSVN